ncbi:uncharacterized protein K452DRAFT_39064 [Aplosporella prunicola CBS 121167]|uniref:CFEM domain-containing protein n=1 Tax=Aplosporella prunicola CBS 121167 TaxID=1176127 RepID=A0A6A6BEP7_9PEZI|nr:uncharacterized protein K452DRAFT_39064 [Aplosporella prunicola CBS 121167]KAF2141397.1 hypothetical protein K452DRAFT_39064 [Aplosporella prunicola CBS 121167]
MKSFAILALGASVALAQSLNDLPQCGKTCINNMLNIAQTEFGCSSGDANCYCGNADFGYGVRDCARQACSSDDDAQNVINYGVQYCRGELHQHALFAKFSLTVSFCRGCCQR